MSSDVINIFFFLCFPSPFSSAHWQLSLRHICKNVDSRIFPPRDNVSAPDWLLELENGCCRINAIHFVHELWIWIFVCFFFLYSCSLLSPIAYSNFLFLMMGHFSRRYGFGAAANGWRVASIVGIWQTIRGRHSNISHGHDNRHGVVLFLALNWGQLSHSLAFSLSSFHTRNIYSLILKSNLMKNSVDVITPANQCISTAYITIEVFCSSDVHALRHPSITANQKQKTNRMCVLRSDVIRKLMLMIHKNQCEDGFASNVYYNSQRRHNNEVKCIYQKKFECPPSANFNNGESYFLSIFHIFNK